MKLDLVPVVPQTGQQTLAPAGDRGDEDTWELHGYPYVRAIVFGIPPDVDATLSVNGQAKLDVNDGQGATGSFEAPSDDHYEVDVIQLEATNLAGIEQDVRLWIEPGDRPP